MILFIIFSILTIAGIVLVIIAEKRWLDWLAIIGASCLVVSGICVFSFGIVAMVNNSTLKCQKVLITYNQKKIELETTKLVIETITDDYARSVAIQNYNNEIAKCRADIETEQFYLHNWFINWYHCRAYAELNINDFQYISSFEG